MVAARLRRPLSGCETQMGSRAMSMLVICADVPGICPTDEGRKAAG
jgi:hypothetical protein